MATKYKPSLTVVVLLLASVVDPLPTVALSQSSCEHPLTRTWIRVEDANNNVDTLWFGYTPEGTCGYDSAACEDWEGGIEPCGAPAAVFCTWWEVCAPSDIIKTYNYHGDDSSGQLDPFTLHFWPGPPNPGYPVRLSWSISGIAALYDSAVIRDRFGGLIFNVRMDQDSAMEFDGPLWNAVDIHTYGRTTSADPAGDPLLPREIRLHQNYPNPFNPTTSISYELNRTDWVRIEITNVAGQLITILEDGQKTMGFHTVVWDARGVPSGVYYCYLITSRKRDITKLTLVR